MKNILCIIGSIYVQIIHQSSYPLDVSSGKKRNDNKKQSIPLYDMCIITFSLHNHQQTILNRNLILELLKPFKNFISIRSNKRKRNGFLHHTTIIILMEYELTKTFEVMPSFHTLKNTKNCVTISNKTNPSSLFSSLLELIKLLRHII